MKIYFKPIILILAVSTAFVSCKKDDEPEEAERELYIKYTIGGTESNHVVGDDGFSNVTGKAYASWIGDYQYTRVYEPTLSGSSSKPDIAVRFLNSNSGDSTYFESMLSPGSYTYYSDSVSTTTQIQIIYDDGNGNEYETDASHANFNPSAHSFQVISHEANTTNDKSRFYTKATFSCVLYEDSGSDSLVVTNGEFELRTIPN